MQCHMMDDLVKSEYEEQLCLYKKTAQQDQHLPAIITSSQWYFHNTHIAGQKTVAEGQTLQMWMDFHHGNYAVDMDITLEDRATVILGVMAQECPQLDLHFRVHLRGSQARSFIYTFSEGKNQDRHHLSVLQEHRGEKGTSKLEACTLLDQQAAFDFHGIIHIHEPAIQTQARQIHKNYLLSEEAHVTTLPELQIYNNDVQCSHGAFGGTFSPEDLFYMQSRGIARETCKSLIAQGIRETTITHFLTCKE